MSRSVLPFPRPQAVPARPSGRAHSSLILAEKLVKTLAAAKPLRDAVRSAERREQRWAVPPTLFFDQVTMTEHAATVPQLPERLVAELSRFLPTAATAWQHLPAILDELFTAMTQAIDVRRAVRTVPELAARLTDFAKDHPGCRALAELVSVPDDLVVRVLHLRQRVGFRVRLRGIVSLDQLHILAADQLTGLPSEGWLVGSRPDPRVGDAYRDQPTDPNAEIATARFQLYRPSVLTATPSRDHTLWGHESPRAIPIWHDDPTLILGDVLFPRRWHAKRPLAALSAELDVLEMLAVEEVVRLLGDSPQFEVRSAA